MKGLVMAGSVLFLEDDPQFAQVLALMLDACGIDIRQWVSEPDLLGCFLHGGNQYNFILLDCFQHGRMTLRGSLETIGPNRQHNTRVIAMTGNPTPEIEEIVREYGLKFLRKPFNLAELREALGTT